MPFDTKLKELRKLNNITQAELAEALGLKRATVTQYESGRISPSKDILIKTANYFRVSVDELVGQSENYGTENLSGGIDIYTRTNKGSDYTASIKSAISQKIIAELYKKNQDPFIKDNRNLFLKLVDILLELNLRAEECKHEFIKVSLEAEEYDVNKIILEFSKELRRLEKLSNLFE